MSKFKWLLKECSRNLYLEIWSETALKQKHWVKGWTSPPTNELATLENNLTEFVKNIKFGTAQSQVQAYLLTPWFDVGCSLCPRVALLHCHVQVVSWSWVANAMQSYSVPTMLPSLQLSNHFLYILTMSSKDSP